MELRLAAERRASHLQGYTKVSYCCDCIYFQGMHAYYLSALELYASIQLQYSRYSGSLKYGHLNIIIPPINLVWHRLLARCLLHNNTRYSVYCMASTGCPKLGFQCTFITAGYDVCVWLWFGR